LLSVLRLDVVGLVLLLRLRLGLGHAGIGIRRREWVVGIIEHHRHLGLWSPIASHRHRPWHAGRRCCGVVVGNEGCMARKAVILRWKMNRIEIGHFASRRRWVQQERIKTVLTSRLGLTINVHMVRRTEEGLRGWCIELWMKDAIMMVLLLLRLESLVEIRLWLVESMLLLLVMKLVTCQG
jgi:hypothetical protein